MKSVCDKTFTLQPVAGPLDMTSSADAVPFGGYRYVENFETNPQDKKMRRMTGYQRLLPTEAYENADLHYRYGLPRQHLTFGFEAKTPAGFTKLYAATQNTLFAKNNATQHWQVIWDGFGGDPNLNGCSEVILQAANVNSTVLFSNDFDEPVYHVIDQPANGDGAFVQPIPDFQELNITRVGFLYAWNNLVIAANIVMDGIRQTNLVLWSDYKKPLSYVPNKESSLAGRKFLAYGEVVLGAAELADALLLYTSRGIWELRVSNVVDAEGNAEVISFTKRYTPDKAGSRCLKFKRTLVSTGDDHYYAGEDGIYRYNFYLPRPEVEEWSRRAASHLFINGTLNKSRCSVHCAGYDTAKKAYWFSYSKAGEVCNSETLVMNTETHFSSVVKEGYSFFLNYNPRTLKSLRQWLIENCICALGSLPALDKCIADAESTCADRICCTIGQRDYTDFVDWEVRPLVEDNPVVDLIGTGTCGVALDDLLPGNGQYIGIGGLNQKTLISTVQEFDLVSGQTYRITIRAAGAQVGDGAYGDLLSIAMDDGVNLFPTSTLSIPFDSDFTDYTLEFVSAVTASRRISIYVESNPVTLEMRQLYLVKSVKFEHVGVEVLFDGNVDDENETCDFSVDTPINYTSAASFSLHDVLAEDWRAEADDQSQREKLAGVTAQDLCGGEFANECSTGTLFIFAAVADRCIKQASDVLFRERCLTFEKCGTYENRGYISIARSGPISLNAPTGEKMWKRFNVEADPDIAAIPGRLSLRVGVAATALDPNKVNCPIYWEALMDPNTGFPFKLQCLSDRTEVQHEAEGTKPDTRYEWPLFHAGKFHYFEITIHNQDSDPLDVGAGVAISRMEFDASLEC